MNFFKYFPKENYLFGDETSPDVFQNISVYADIIDQVKDNTTIYENYYIQQNERPDQVSYKLYDTPDYYWTFFAFNDKIRECGWPVSAQQVFDLVTKKFPDTTLNVNKDLSTTFEVGDPVIGVSNGIQGTVIRRNLDLGQLVVRFTPGSNVLTTQSYQSGANQINASEVISQSLEYLSAHHYLGSDQRQIHILDSDGSYNFNLGTPITQFDDYTARNNDLKEIKVIKPAQIEEVVALFREAIQS